MRQYKLILLFFVMLSTSLLADQSAELLGSAVTALKRHTSAEFETQARQKFFDSDDTINEARSCVLSRETTDSIFHGFIRMTTSDSTFIVYDLALIYEVNKKSRKITTFNPHNGENWLLSDFVLWKHFLQPEKLKNRLTDAATSYQRDTIIDNCLCHEIISIYPDEEEFSDFKQWIFIRSKDSVPVLMRSSIRYQGKYQYREVKLSDIRFDSVPKQIFSSSNLPVSYTMVEYQATASSETLLLDTGTIAPSIFGKIIGGKSNSTDTIDFHKSVTLIDFWYMACYPCIKSIPQIERVRLQYDSAALQVFSVNSVDNTDKGLKRLPKFLEYNRTQTPLLFVDQSVTSEYQVRIYPSFYLIDRDGKVVYARTGYSETLGDELANEIQKLLEKQSLTRSK